MAWAVLAATLAGLVAGDHLAPGPGLAFLALAAGAALAASSVPRARAALVLVAVVALATASMLRARDGMVDPPVDAPPGVITVEVVGDPQPSLYGARAVARLDGRLVLLVTSRPVSSRLVVVEAGDVLVVAARPEPLEAAEAQRWRHRHVAMRLVVSDVLGLRDPPSPLLRLANHVRHRLLSGTTALPSPERGLVEGLLVGDTRGVPDDVLDAFRAAGLSHLLAVSGANVAFVLALVAPVLSRLGLRGRLAGALAVIVLFAAVTRFEPSVLRASAMAGLGVVAWAVGRPAAGLRLLALAATGLLLADPFLLHSLGFRLSCAASAGILLLARPLGRRLPDPLAVTAAAQVGVLPVLVPAFGPPPLVALPANLLAVPLAAPITAWGMASGLLGGWAPLQAPTYLLARLLIALARGAAGMPLP